MPVTCEQVVRAPKRLGGTQAPSNDMSDSQVYEQWKHALRLRLGELLDNGARATGASTLDRKTISTQLSLLNNTLLESGQAVLSTQEQKRLIEELANEVIGLGPLEPLVADPEVTEIMVNGPSQVFVERHGRLERASATFRDEQHVMAVIERLLESARLSVTETNPCVDASLPDGSRINVIIPPLVLNGPTLTIRKKLRQWKMEEVVSLESLSPEAAEFLEACVKAKVNFVISGGTSTGKTTLVSILSCFIPRDERIITIENVAELELPNREHWIRLVSRSSNMEGRGEVPLRTLVRNALRMRPDRIILGEARSGEALDVVQAMHTGHEGVMTVLHANSPEAALERLETLMLMSGLDLPPQVCRAQIASVVDVVVHLSRYTDGRRRITSIAHVLGSSQGGFQLEELFVFEVRGFQADGMLDGGLRYTGVRPKFLPKFQVSNVPIPAWINPELRQEGE